MFNYDMKPLSHQRGNFDGTPHWVEIDSIRYPLFWVTLINNICLMIATKREIVVSSHRIVSGFVLFCYVTYYLAVLYVC